jgi:hypothetical protein
LLSLAFLILAPLAYGCLALWLGQDANWDFRNYHWYNGYAFWTGRYALDLLPSQTPFFYNPTLDVPYYLLASHVPAKIAGFILAAVQGLNFVLLFMLAHVSLNIADPRRKVWSAAALAAMGVLGAGAIAQVGTTFYDNVTSLGIFASALLIARNLAFLRTAPWLRAVGVALLAGVLSGLMMGLKLPSVIFCVGLCGALLFVSGFYTRRFLLALGFGLGVLLGLGVSLGHWASFLQTHFGSPLFPYFNQIFKSPLAPLTSARDIQFLPTTWQDRLLFPFIFTESPLRVGEIPWRDFRLVALYTLLPVALIWRMAHQWTGQANWIGKIKRLVARLHPAHSFTSPEAARFLLSMAVIAYVVWLLIFAIYRYAVPLEMLAPLLLVFAVDILPLNFKMREWIAVLLLAVLAVTVQGGNWGRRDIWLDHAVEITRPDLPNSPQLMILMAGLEPYSHILSEFPPQIPFVRIQSNFSSPDDGKGINEVIRDRVRAHQAEGGSFMILIPSWQHKIALNALKYFSFTFQPETCQTVDDHLYEKLDLCIVSPLTKKMKNR